MGLLYNGTDLAGHLKVEDYREHGMQFVPGRGARKRLRVTKPELVVLHWTGAENAPEKVYANLQKRTPPVGGLGCHLVTHGTRIVQLCDLQHAAFCGGPKTNDRGVHIEAVNKGRGPSTRRVYKALIHGEWEKCLAFTDEEVETICALTSRLCEVFSIPKVLAGRAGIAEDKVMSAMQVSRFAGVLGHFQVEPGKYDPGTQLFDALILHHNFRMQEV